MQTILNCAVWPSVAYLTGDDVTEQLPLLALESYHLELLDRSKIVRRGVDLDAGQQRVGLEILQARRLSHDVLAGEIVAAHLKHLHHGLRGGIAEHHGSIELVGLGIVLSEERVKP